MKRSLFICLVAYVTTYFFPSDVFAQTANNIVTVSPSIISLDLSTDKSQATLTYTNHSPDTIAISLSAQNFTSLEDGYQLSFLSPKDANNYAYGLSSWIQFGSRTLVVEPYQSTSVTIYVEKNKLSPGGHYASILASINPDATTNRSVTIKAILASLLFVRTQTGQEKDNGNFASFELTRNFLEFPDTVSFRFNNSGDEQVVPYGLVTIIDSHKIVVAKGIVNVDSALTLPQTIRRYYVPLSLLTSFVWPGFYTATIRVHFGTNNKTITTSQQFFTQGSLPLLTLFLITLVFAALLFWYKKIRK